MHHFFPVGGSNTYSSTFPFQEYQLEGGETTKSPNEAAGKFLQREFPHVLNCDKTPHDVIFVPETFIYNGLTEKVIILTIFLRCLNFELKISY